MKILLVEDDYNKRAHLGEALHSMFPHSEIRVAMSYQSGLSNIRTWRPDLVVLDMTLPTFDLSPSERGGRTRPFGGREILIDIDRRALLCKVVVVTQFESFGKGREAMSLKQLSSELKTRFGRVLIGTIHYQAGSTSWREELRLALSGLVTTGEPSKGEDDDLGADR